MPETRPAAGALCRRVRAWHARKFARFLRPRKEFGRVKTTRIMIGRSVEPSRETPAEGFLFWLFAFGAASAQRHDTEGSVEAPSPRPVKARLQRSSFFNFLGGRVLGHRRALQACRAGFNSVTVHQFRECSSTARIRACHARDTGSTPVARSNFEARSSTAEPAAHNGQVARSTRAAPTSPEAVWSRGSSSGS